jgi:hypothetical protein
MSPEQGLAFSFRSDHWFVARSPRERRLEETNPVHHLRLR